MKNIVFVALLVILVASQPMPQCTVGKCTKQRLACTREVGCNQTLNSCMQAFEKEYNINKLNNCLQQSNNAPNLMDCLAKCCNNSVPLAVREMLHL